MITFETYKDLPASHLAIQMISDLVAHGWQRPDSMAMVDSTVDIFTKRISMYLEENQPTLEEI